MSAPSVKFIECLLTHITLALSPEVFFGKEPSNSSAFLHTSNSYKKEFFKDMVYKKQKTLGINLTKDAQENDEI